jgi:DNA-binding SARP family transcriptional activator/predicted ATPase
MDALSLSLLGPFTATLNDQPLNNIKNRKIQALLIYLAVERDHPHRREALFTLLWPGMPEKSARHNLSQTLYALRQILADSKDDQGNAVPWLLVDRQTLQLNPTASIEVDIHQLDRLLAGTRQHDHQRLENCQHCIDRLETALILYRGDFLSGFYLEDSNEFEAWAEAVRETYRHKLVELLGTLSDIATQAGDHEHAIRYIDRQLAFDDLSERANHQKIEVLALAGRRVEAMRQYHEFVRRLEDQLGTNPSQEITALYERIRSSDLSTIRHEPTETESIDKTTMRHNLVPQPTPFIGREEELSQLDEMLQDPNIRLITIVGPGGMGKTRLAIACAQRQLDPISAERKGSPFSDGVFLISLADLDTPDQIPKDIATSLGLEFGSGEIMHRRVEAVDPGQQILAYLANRHMLLILDNFEHLQGGGAFLAELLKSAPMVRLLVTSRERLNLHEEHLYPITGMTFPGDEEIQDYQDYTAFLFFQQCAKRLQPGYAIDSGDLSHLTSICQKLDGMPLGLELAASWVDLLTPQEIAGELQKGLDFLESDLANIPERHRSLTVVCNSTWEFLNPTQQTHLKNLSVFRGGFTRQAAEQVFGISLRSLRTLVKKSLLQFDENEARYRFHPYLRHFAAQKLAENPEEEFEVWDAHSAYFCTELHANQQTHEAGQPYIAVQRTEKEYANIQTAWIWAVDQLNLERIYQGLDGLCLFYDWGGRRIYEGLTTCQYVNRKLAKSDHKPTIHDNEDNRNLYEKIHAKVMLWEVGFNHYYNSFDANRLLDASRQKLTKLENSGYDVHLELGQHGLWRFNHLAQRTQNTEYKKLKSLLLDSLSSLQDGNFNWWQCQVYSMLSTRLH